MPEVTFDVGDTEYDAGEFSKRKGHRKPSEAFNKVSIYPTGKLKIGTTLLNLMLDRAGIDKQQKEAGEKADQYVYVACGIGIKKRGQTVKYANFQQPYLMMHIGETEKEVMEQSGKILADGIRKLHFKGGYYSNIPLICSYHDQYKGSEGFLQLQFKEEKIPTLPVDPPIKDKNGKEIKEHKITRTDFTFESAVHLNPDNGAIRIWGNEGHRITNPLPHQPSDPKNRKKKGK